jgi:integrase
MDRLQALRRSNCQARPSEVARVKAEHVDLKLGIWKFERHKTSHKTNKPRIIYLSPRLLELTEAQLAKYPTGPLLPNRRGKAYSKNAIVCRFRRLREKLPHLGKFFSYLYRYSYCTDALELGVDVAHVSELLGHTSTMMVMTKYSKLSKRVEHLRSMAAKAMGSKVSL